MRKPEAYLLDMVEAADRIGRYVADMDRVTFLASDMAKAAVVREVEIMGEAAGRIPERVRTAHPEVPWAEIARLRNFYIHIYHGLDYHLVWTTATATVPRIASAVRAMIPAPHDPTSS